MLNIFYTVMTKQWVLFCIYQERFNYLIKNEYKDVIKKTSCDI